MTKFDEFGLPEPTKYPQMPKVVKMNSRIQELAAQAKQQVPSGLVVDQWIERYNEELAKLIIEDCVQVIYKEERTPPQFIQPKSACAYELSIRIHFGIEK